MAQTTIKGLVRFFSFLFMIALASTQTPLCPNNLAVYNPNLRTECVNASMCTPKVFISTLIAHTT